MIAYSEEWIKVKSILSLSIRWTRSGIITQEDLIAIQKVFRQEYRDTTNILLRIGIIVLILIAIFAAFGLVSRITSDDYARDVSFIFSFICYVALEYSISKKNSFSTGIDDALQIASSVFFYSGIVIIFDDQLKNVPDIAYAIAAFPIAVYFTARFMSLLFAAALICCLFIILFLLQEQTFAAAHSAIPFQIMGWAVILYFIIKKLQNVKMLRPWFPCLLISEIFVILTFYTASNYFAVRQFNVEFWEMKFTKDMAFPLAGLHFFLTGLIPVLFICTGVINKDRILIRIGLLTCIFSAFTFQNHFFEEYLQEFLLVSGIIFMLTAIMIKRYIGDEKHGFTARNIFIHELDDLNIDAILIDKSGDMVKRY